MADPTTELLKALNRYEKATSNDHRLRHVHGALREARYNLNKIEQNGSYLSPGQKEAEEAAAKVHVPAAEDPRNPNVPTEGGESSASNDGGTA